MYALVIGNITPKSRKDDHALAHLENKRSLKIAVSCS